MIKKQTLIFILVVIGIIALFAIAEMVSADIGYDNFFTKWNELVFKK